MTTKEKTAYRREKRSGKSAMVRRLSMGGSIIKQGEEFHAFDKNDRFLGWTNDEEEAEYMAYHGLTNSTCEESANQISLWMAWNDAVDSGTQVLEAPSGDQVMLLGDCIYMVAEVDGACVELITDVEIGQRYADPNFPCVRMLKPVENGKAFRL